MSSIFAYVLVYLKFAFLCWHIFFVFIEIKIIIQCWLLYPYFCHFYLWYLFVLFTHSVNIKKFYGTGIPVRCLASHKARFNPQFSTLVNHCSKSGILQFCFHSFYMFELLILPFDKGISNLIIPWSLVFLLFYFL